MNKTCDLHTHSIFSDGSFTPAEIIDKATKIGLSAVALTDHNTVNGIPEFLRAAERANIEAIIGAEFSVDYNGTELHLLGLYIPEEKLCEVSELMQTANKRKEESNMQLIHSLNRAGYNINYADLKSKHPNSKINRAHIASHLTELGYTESISHAFKTLLSKSHGHYTEPERITVFDMLDFLKMIGAVPVLAHPFLDLAEEELITFLPLAKEHGLVGMECYYSLYDEMTIKKSLELASRFGLKPSGGSDFHGTHKPDIKLGTGKDNLRIPYECAQNLKPDVL